MSKSDEVRRKGIAQADDGGTEPVEARGTGVAGPTPELRVRVELVKHVVASGDGSEFGDYGRFQEGAEHVTAKNGPCVQV